MVRGNRATVSSGRRYAVKDANNPVTRRQKAQTQYIRDRDYRLRHHYDCCHAPTIYYWSFPLICVFLERYLMYVQSYQLVNKQPAKALFDSQYQVSRMTCHYIPQCNPNNIQLCQVRKFPCEQGVVVSMCT